MNTTATAGTTTRRLALRGGVVLGAVALAAGLTACGSSGTQVYERESNGATHGIATLQPGKYRLDLSCTDKRSSRKVNGKTRKSGATPTVSLSTVINGQQVETDANCSGSDSEKFTVATVSELRFDATLNGSATYTAKVLLQQ
jgi:hypothetical protein